MKEEQSESNFLVKDGKPYDDSISDEERSSLIEDFYERQKAQTAKVVSYNKSTLHKKHSPREKMIIAVVGFMALLMVVSLVWQAVGSFI